MDFTIIKFKYIKNSIPKYVPLNPILLDKNDFNLIQFQSSFSKYIGSIEIKKEWKIKSSHVPDTLFSISDLYIFWVKLKTSIFPNKLSKF